MRSTIAVLVAVVLCGAAALARQKADTRMAKGTVVVRAEAHLGDQIVPPGRYVAEVLAGEDPVLVLTLDGDEVARAVVDRHETPAPMPYDQIRIGTNATGVNEIVAVTFKGRRDTFTIRNAEQIANSAKP
jgi:hypothetical protein